MPDRDSPEIDNLPNGAPDHRRPPYRPNVIRALKSRLLWATHLVAPRLVFGPGFASSRRLSRVELNLLLFEPWYHDYRPLGVRTLQHGGIYERNQTSKQDVLFPMIDRAIDLCRASTQDPSVVELFCADGFYASYCASRGLTSIEGVDLDEHEIHNARLATRVLGHDDRVTFSLRSVSDLERSYEIGICAGGLYHLTEPGRLLRTLTENITHALVVQSLISLVDESEDHFEAPAPGQDWGSRFSYAHLRRLLVDAGWRILDEARNELEGNVGALHRGSAYFLCAPPE